MNSIIIRTHAYHYVASSLVLLAGIILSNYRPVPWELSATIVVIGFYYFYHTLNLRVEINAHTVTLGFLIHKQLQLSEVISVYPRDFFRGQSSHTLVISTKHDSIRLSTRAFDKYDLLGLKPFLEPIAQKLGTQPILTK